MSSLHPLHDLHHRRASRNIGLLVVLLAFVVIIFGLSMVKIKGGDMMEAFDHQPRASMLPRDPDARPRVPTADTPLSAGSENEVTP